jgi:hypothetical protein
MWTASRCWQTDHVERDAGSSSGSSSGSGRRSAAAAAPGCACCGCPALPGGTLAYRRQLALPWQLKPSAFHMSTV